MARKAMKRTRRGRSRRQRGGASAAYTFGPAVAPGAPYASEVIAQEACGAAARPGYLASAPAGSGGLPGFAGGARRRRTYRARGGRYTLDMAAATGGPNPFVPVARIGCEGGMVNTAPPGAAPNPVPATLQAGGQLGPSLRIAGRSMARAVGHGAREITSGLAARGAQAAWKAAAPRPPLATPGGLSKRRGPHMAGGAGIALTGSGVSGAVDTAAYYAPTAGYGNTPSSWVSSAGVPSLLQTPYEARAMNPACLKTGGGKRRNRRGIRKSRKSRKTRKSRK